ncbi:hypothetical protein [Halomonas daqiaonensis]|uniref:Uncharacterized protein n=1 Tax=Halomonas daqiaonensis TaxID=650850 RepID=A0A1H7FJW7_9GAMM|nr:hypothetical protein [Halomonas daqiaonensis]SEK26403.1 hypothetical protein SAMN04488129_101147 [Halomonas daqiaonensis]
MKPIVTGLLAFSMMTFAMVLDAQDATNTNPRLAPDKGEDTKQFPDSFFNKREKQTITLPSDQQQYPDSVFDEERQKRDIQRKFPDSVFDEKRRSP